MIARKARRASNAAPRRNVDALCKLLREAVARERRRRTVVGSIQPVRPASGDAAPAAPPPDPAETAGSGAEVVVLAAYRPAGIARCGDASARLGRNLR